MYIQKVEGWHAPASLGMAYENLLFAAGTDSFGSTLCDALASATAGVRRMYLFEASGREESRLQYAFCEPELEPLLPVYHSTYLRLDPVCHAYAATPRLGDVALQRIRPADVRSSGLRRLFFDDRGIVERVSVVQRGPRGWRAINAARHRTEGAFADRELDALLALACLALPMLAFGRSDAAPMRAPTVAELEQRFRGHCAELSERERQVCARAAIGMSVEAAAIDLGVEKTTVRTYRKRAYSRLGVTSAIELCALVSI